MSETPDPSLLTLDRAGDRGSHRRSAPRAERSSDVTRTRGWLAGAVVGGLGLAAAYGLYTLGAALSALFVWRYVHETRGRELEQMEG